MTSGVGEMPARKLLLMPPAIQREASTMRRFDSSKVSGAPATALRSRYWESRASPAIASPLSNIAWGHEIRRSLACKGSDAAASTPVIASAAKQSISTRRGGSLLLSACRRGYAPRDDGGRAVRQDAWCRRLLRGQLAASSWGSDREQRWHEIRHVGKERPQGQRHLPRRQFLGRRGAACLGAVRRGREPALLQARPRCRDHFLRYRRRL